MSLATNRSWRRWFLLLTLLILVGGAWAATRYLARPIAHSLTLADGTQIYFYPDSKASPAPGYPQPREIRVDGDFLLRAPPASAPLIVRSRLLILTITGQAALRITARSYETGEEVQVLSGNVLARKSYPSSYETPDTLAAGQMVMINRTIDLMEKENFDPSELRAWSTSLMELAVPSPAR